MMKPADVFHFPCIGCHDAVGASQVPPPTIGDEEYEEHLPVVKNVPALRRWGAYKPPPHPPTSLVSSSHVCLVGLTRGVAERVSSAVTA